MYRGYLDRKFELFPFIFITNATMDYLCAWYHRSESKCICNFDRYFQTALHINCKQSALLVLMYKDRGYTFNFSAILQRYQTKISCSAKREMRMKTIQWGVRSELSSEFICTGTLWGSGLYYYLQIWILMHRKIKYLPYIYIIVIGQV